MNKREALTLIGQVIMLFPEVKFSSLDMAADLWSRVMPDIKLDHATAAIIKRSRKTSKPPAPADIVKAVSEMFPEAGAPPSADDAFEEVIKTANAYKKPTYSHPLIAETVDTFEYRREICYAENVAVLRAQFLKAYDRKLTKWRDGKANAKVFSIINRGQQSLALEDLSNQVATKIGSGR